MTAGECADRRLSFAEAAGAGVRLAVRLTPSAAPSGLDGMAADADGRSAPRLRVAAPPVDRAANTELVEHVASSLQMRKSDAAIVSGGRGRLKLLELSGNSATLLVRLAARVDGARRR